MKHIIVSLFIIIIFSIQLHSQFGSQDSGGPLTPEWAAYNVKFYNINLNINPDKQTINGWVGVTVEAVTDMKKFVLDLDDRYRVTKIVWASLVEYKELSFKHESGKIKIQLPQLKCWPLLFWLLLQSPNPSFARSLRLIMAF